MLLPKLVFHGLHPTLKLLTLHSQHRIIESLRLEKALKIIKSNLLCSQTKLAFSCLHICFLLSVQIRIHLEYCFHEFYTLGDLFTTAISASPGLHGLAEWDCCLFLDLHLFEVLPFSISTLSKDTRLWQPLPKLLSALWPWNIMLHL